MTLHWFYIKSSVASPTMDLLNQRNDCPNHSLVYDNPKTHELKAKNKLMGGFHGPILEVMEY